MVLKATDFDQLKQLKPGDFAVPELDMNTPPVLADSPRLKKSIKGMFTIMCNKGFEQAVRDFDACADDDFAVKTQALERSIESKIKLYFNRPRSDDAIREVFHLIQLWGGVAGRGIYNQDGGFAKNFDCDAYKSLIDVALNPDPCREKNIQRAEKATNEIRYFGISFSTKHLRFWSLFGCDGSFAIYDRVMAKGCFGRKSPLWSHYGEYISGLKEVAEKQRVTINEIERFCFAFFDSEDGRRWLKARSGN